MIFHITFEIVAYSSFVDEERGHLVEIWDPMSSRRKPWLKTNVPETELAFAVILMCVGTIFDRTTTTRPLHYNGTSR